MTGESLRNNGRCSNHTWRPARLARAYRADLLHQEKDLRRALRDRWGRVSSPLAEPGPGVARSYQFRRRMAKRIRWGFAILLALLVLWPLGSPLLRAAVSRQEETPIKSLFPDPTPQPTSAAGEFSGLVAFTAREKAGDDADIFLLNPGSPLVNLTDDPGEDGWPAWSPDGEWVAFLSDRAAPTDQAGKLEVFVTNLSGSRVVQLTAEPGIDWLGPLSWSADGQRLALAGLRMDQASQSWIYEVPLDGSGPRPLSDTRGGWAPEYSPSGERLAYTTWEGGRAGVVVQHLASADQVTASWPVDSGSRAVSLRAQSGLGAGRAQGSPTWQPDRSWAAARR